MENILQQICYLIVLFFTFSVCGWCMEVVLKYIQYGRFINRGFLIGPYCPIYGAGIVFITLMVRLLSGVETSVGTTFVISFVGCGTLEYAASYYMEKRFHVRWWDYSTKPMNLNGRIWIGNLILFGLGGTIFMEVVYPLIYRLFHAIPDTVLYILSGGIVIGMLVDYMVSHFVMRFVKISVESSEADSTESISREIKLLMSDKSILYKRIADAYPDVIYRTERINQRMNELKAEVERLSKEAGVNLERVKEETSVNMERLKQEASANVERLKQEASYNLELMKTSPSELKDEIIFSQESLIRCLEEQPEDQKQIAALHQNILEKKQLLDEREKWKLAYPNKEAAMKKSRKD